MKNKLYFAKRIFIASPGDLLNERKIFHDVINEVNKIKAHSLGFHLEPLGWEDTMPGKGRPQSLINEDLAMCDLFVMLLWKRWGTPSGEFSSGTEEEYHVASTLYAQHGVPEMWVFFKDTDNVENQNSLDETKINQFRKKIEEEKTLLYKKFTNENDWERLLRINLCQWVDNLITGSNKNYSIPIPNSNDIKFDISYVDQIKNNSKTEIYLTLSDSESYGYWKNLTITEKKYFMFDNLNKFLYLNLGTNPYILVVRFKLIENMFLFLGRCSFVYGSAFEESNFYITTNYNETMVWDEVETTLYENQMSISRMI